MRKQVVKPTAGARYADDVVPDIAEFEAMARAREYSTVEHLGFEYRNVSVIKDPVKMGIPRMIKRATGKLKVTVRDALFRIHGRGDGDISTAWIHADSDMSKWAAVLYLYDAEPGLVSGTGFFRFKGLEANRIFHPQMLAWVRRYKDTGTSDEQLEQFLIDAGNDESKWDLDGLIVARRGRMAIYPTELFHAALPRHGQGHGRSDARLVMAAFFDFE